MVVAFSSSLVEVFPCHFSDSSIATGSRLETCSRLETGSIHLIGSRLVHLKLVMALKLVFDFVDSWECDIQES